MLLVLVLVISARLTLVCLKGPWSSSALGPLAAMSAITAGVIGIDLLTGSHLQISSIFGLQPLVGGRFYGMGNVAFALYAAAVLLLCAALAHALVRRDAPRLAVFAVVVVGRRGPRRRRAPRVGRRLRRTHRARAGARLPAHGRHGLAHVGAQRRRSSCSSPASSSGSSCYLDWRRPEAERSHPGRFLQTVIDGGAWDVMSRKLWANVSLCGAPAGAARPRRRPHGGRRHRSWLRPGTFGTEPLRRLLEEAPLMHRGLLSVIVMAVIGFLTNDSGAAIPPVAAIFTVPLVVSAVMHFLSIEARNAPVRRRRDRHHL